MFGNREYAFGSGRRRGRYPTGSGQAIQVVDSYVDPQTGDLIEVVEERGTFLESTAGKVAVGVAGLAVSIGITYFAAKAGASAARR